MALEYTTEIAGERYGADERAQFEVTVDDSRLVIRDRLNRDQVTMTHADFDQLTDIIAAYRDAVNALESR